MNLNLLLDMAADGYGDRVAVGSATTGITFVELARRARAGGAVLRDGGAKHLVYLGRNGPVVSQALLAAASAGIPFTPVNYRLSPDRLALLIDQFPEPLVIVDAGYEIALQPRHARWTADDFVTALTSTRDGGSVYPESTVPAVQLFTSGTTSEPKVVSLSHGNLASYVVETVEFGSAARTDCALTATPPYHIAAIASILSNMYAGRRVVYLPDFDAAEWLRLVREERVTSAMVVPTMLSSIVDRLGGQQADTPDLRLLTYGGARAAPTVVEAAMAAFPGVGFVNAYGLTETSSTVALLGPEDHRLAVSSDDPRVRRRLISVGRPVPGVEIQIRGGDGRPLPAGQPGELWLRGAQISAQSVGSSGLRNGESWFATRDQAYVDGQGYLYIEGRLDDTIIRGGENIAPTELEDVLRCHPAISDVAVLGVRDAFWGERIVAAVVPRVGAAPGTEELREWARARLRSSRTPDEIVCVSQLPYSPTGKLLRHKLALLLDFASHPVHDNRGE